MHGDFGLRQRAEPGLALMIEANPVRHDIVLRSAESAMAAPQVRSGHAAFQ
jgi:hypothetical protein